MGDADVSLRALRCPAPGCPDRRALVPDGEPGAVVCRACGHRAAAADVFRPYAARTGQFAVGAGVMLSLAFVSRSPLGRWALVAVGATQLALFLWRIVYQARTLRRLRAARPR